MAIYRIHKEAKEDLIRIHQNGIVKFGLTQADKYFDTFFIIAERPFSFESLSYIKKGYRRCVCCSDSIFFGITGQDNDILAIVGSRNLMEWLTFITDGFLSPKIKGIQPDLN